MIEILTMFVIAFFVVGVLYTIIISPYMLAKGLALIEDGYVDMAVKVKAFTPFLNGFVSARYYDMHTGSRVGYVNAVSGSLFYVAFVIRTVIMFVAPDMILLAYITMILSFITLLVAWVTSAMMSYGLISEDYDVTGIKRVMYIVIPPIGNYYIGSYLAASLDRANRHKEAMQ